MCVCDAVSVLPMWTVSAWMVDSESCLAFEVVSHEYPPPLKLLL